jgi:hypothetical protein
VQRAVHAEQDGGTGDAKAVERLDDGEVGRVAGDPVLASDVDGQLRVLAGAALARA